MIKYIFHTSFWLITIYHLLVFLGNVFLVGPLQFAPAAYLLNGEPLQNIGNDIIRFLIIIWGIWYMGSILGVVYAYFKKSDIAMKAAVLAPTLYNLVTGIGIFTFFINIQVFNTDVVPISAISIMHFFAASLFIVLFILAKKVFRQV